MRMRSNGPSEPNIERKHAKQTIDTGWFVEKIMRTGKSGFPDRFYAKAGRVVLIEWKKPGGTVSKQQELRHIELRAAGVEVYVVDNIDTANAILRISDGKGRDEDTSPLDL